VRIMADLEALDQFNSIIKRLVRFAVGKSPKLDWGNAIKRVKLLLDDAPLAAMSALGPGLSRHRASVMASDDKYFMTVDLSADIPAELSGNKKEIVAIIGVIREVYATCSPVEQKATLGDLKQLLMLYDTYNARRR
jgi:hypothetical protein